MGVDPLRSRSPDGVHHHNHGAVGPGRLDRGPQVPVGDQGVGAPQQDRPGVPEVLGVHAQWEPVHVGRPQPCRHPTQVAVHAGGAQGIEEALGHDPHLDQALGAGEGVGEHGLRPVAVDGCCQPGGHLRDRFVP